VNSHPAPIRFAKGVDDRQGIEATMQLHETRGRATPERVARGVYWARYTKNGRPICYCVDSRGDVRKRYVVMHDSRCEAAVEALWAHLDLVDPIRRRPNLRLVTAAPIGELPGTERKGRVVVFDPYDMPPLPWEKTGREN
jgi:hypothetical protein